MKYVTFIKELTKKCADILPYILMLSVILDVLFFRSQISPNSRLNFQILKKVLKTRHLEDPWGPKSQIKIKKSLKKNKIKKSPPPA